MVTSEPVSMKHKVVAPLILSSTSGRPIGPGVVIVAIDFLASVAGTLHAPCPDSARGCGSTFTLALLKGALFSQVARSPALEAQAPWRRIRC